MNKIIVVLKMIPLLNKNIFFLTNQQLKHFQSFQIKVNIFSLQKTT